MNTDPIRHLSNTINNIAHGVNFKIQALVTVLEQFNPGFAEAFGKQEFFLKCMGVMMGSEQLRANPPSPSAVSMLKANTDLIEELRKIAEENGWMEVFKKAEKESKRMAEKEAQASSIRILP